MTMQETVNRNVLADAVGRKIFCPDCNASLTLTDAVLITSARGAGISCGSCWDRGYGAKYTLAELASAGIEVLDGRSL